MFCIPQELVDLFKTKLKSGEINPEKLSEMTSAERHATFANVLGEANARSINALFESKLLLKNQQQGIINWAKKVAGLKPEQMRDILSRVDRMEKVLDPAQLDSFLQDLASQRLGFDVTMAESAKIVELARVVKEKKAQISESSPIGSKERLEYGSALALFKEYIGELKLEKKGLSDYIKHPVDTISELAGITKSLLSTLDNSFFGRQGLKVLFTSPSTWASAFKKSWGDIGKELKGQNAILPIKSDIYSRPNALNNTYQRMKLDIGIGTEEAFPSSLPERIPLLGRVFKGAESAFNGAALRMRADLADKYIKIAKDQGVNLMDKAQAESLGAVINSLTGRGAIKSFTPSGLKMINNTFFSIKFLKSQFDVLSQPFNPNITPFARKLATTNLAKVVGSIAAIQLLSNILNPGSVDSKHLGKIKIGDTWLDVTGGLASIANLANNIRIKLQTQSGKYGEVTALDIVEGFFEGKLSPLAGLGRDILKGQNFDRERVTFTNALTGLVTPLSIQSFEQIMNSPDSDKIMLLMILEGLGINTNTPIQSKPKTSKFK